MYKYFQNENKTKQTLTITTLGLLALLLCGLVFHLSCKKEDSCSGCYLTNAELAFIIYTQGQKVIFKNDTTNALDTLHASSMTYGSSVCSSPCDEQYGRVDEYFTFSHLEQFEINISATAKDIPAIFFSSINIGNNWAYNFNLEGSTQTVSVNSTTYNDIYSIQIDSTIISTRGNKLTVPWKIYYSKSQGFVRFYMVNGQTWSKL